MMMDVRHFGWIIQPKLPYSNWNIYSNSGSVQLYLYIDIISCIHSESVLDLLHSALLHGRSFRLSFMSLLPGLMDSFLDSRCGYEVKRESNPINDSSGCEWFLKWLHFAPTRTNHIKCVSCEMSMVDCYYWYQIDTGRVQYY